MKVEKDKWQHIGACVLIVLVIGVLASLGLGMSDVASMLTGGGVAVVASVAKEIWDAQGHGDASWADLAADGVGIVAGEIVLLLILMII